jgi:hypothetical protein
MVSRIGGAMNSQTVRSLVIAAVVATAAVNAACSGVPGEQGLRDSFAQQLGANKFVKDFQRNGDDMTFVGPGPEGGTAKWRVHLDSAVVEPNQDKSNPSPYKGTVKSSWYADDKKIEPGARQSNLPFELNSNGLSQECFAYWDQAGKKWGWE